MSNQAETNVFSLLPKTITGLRVPYTAAEIGGAVENAIARLQRGIDSSAIVAGHNPITVAAVAEINAPLVMRIRVLSDLRSRLESCRRPRLICCPPC